MKQISLFSDKVVDCLEIMMLCRFWKLLDFPMPIVNRYKSYADQAK